MPKDNTTTPRKPKGKVTLAGSLLTRDTAAPPAPAAPLPAQNMTRAQAKRELKSLFPESRLLAFKRKYRGVCCPVAFGLWHKPCEQHMDEYLHSRVRTTAWRNIHALLEPVRCELFGYDPTLLTDYTNGITPSDLRSRVNAVLAYRPHGALFVQLKQVLDAITEAEYAKFVPAGMIQLPAEELSWLRGERQLYAGQESADWATQDKEYAASAHVVYGEKNNRGKQRPLKTFKTGTLRNEGGSFASHDGDTSGRPDADDYGEESTS